MRYLKMLFAALLLLIPLAAHAADLGDVVHLGAGINGAWFDNGGSVFPADVEVGGNAAASLSPHLSAVAALYYGFDHSYFRYSVGGRMTVTDVDNPDFSVGLGIQYHSASEAALDPSEWCPDASFGWRALPKLAPKLLVVGQSSYGLTSSKARTILGLRWQIQ